MSQRKARGFTLIEVLVALSIFAILSVVGYRGLSSLIQVKERLADENRKWQQLMLFYDRFEMDVRQTVNRPSRSREDVLEPAWVGHPTFAGDDGAQLLFSRLGDPGQSGFLMDTRRVGYRLHDGAIELLIWPSVDLAPGARPEVFKALQGVSQLSITYITTEGNRLADWPEPNARKDEARYLPAAVEVGLRLESGEVVSRVFAL